MPDRRLEGKYQMIHVIFQVTGVMSKEQILQSKVTEKIELKDSDSASDSEEEEVVMLDKV